MKSIINIASGKGGTGKTLFAATIAEALGNIGVSVLVVDMDIFVRGLTALLYFHKREALNLAPKEKLSVSDLFTEKIEQSSQAGERKLGISRYRSFDVLPAVKRIDEKLSYKDILPDTREEAKAVIKNLLNTIPNEYEIVLLDSRSGYDELIAATHMASTATICIEEDDSISKITADNLISQLEDESNIPLFRLINKSKDIKKVSDIEDDRRGVTDLGKIPFDRDVMVSFGSDRFWDEIPRSLYKVGLVSAWNRLSAKLLLKSELKSERISPIGSERIESKIALVTWKNRVFLIYGLLIGVMGLGYAFMGEETLYLLKKDPTRLVGLSFGLVGLALAILTITRQGK